MARSRAFPAHHNVVLNGAKSDPATAKIITIDFQDWGSPRLHIRSTARAESSGLHVSIIVSGQKRAYSGRTSVVGYSASNGTFRTFQQRFLSTSAVIVQSTFGRQRLVCSWQNAVSPADISRCRLGEIHEQRVERRNGSDIHRAPAVRPFS